jgi:hypothetical protein
MVAESLTETRTESSSKVTTVVDTQDQAEVRRWQSLITRAKMRWKPDFKRMRDNMDFVSGIQWPGQSTMEDERYVNNLTLRFVNQKVATLYAKNPKATAVRRKRLDFQIWDGNHESLVDAMMQATPMLQVGMPLPMQLAALFADYDAGRQRQKIVEMVGKTMEIAYQYQVDTQSLVFKEQMKQLVRRAIVTGVGFVRIHFCDDNPEYAKASSDYTSTNLDRLNRIKGLVDKIEETGVDTSSSHYATLRSLVMSVGASQTLTDQFQQPQRIEFDFPDATSIIPDECCRNLKDFVAARWLTQEYILPLDEVNEIFGTEVKVGSGAANLFDEYGRESYVDPNRSAEQEGTAKQQVCLYNVLDKRTQTQFFLVDGWKDYVQKPQLLSPSVSGFWPIFALTFNDVEPNPQTKASIYPPSDVQMVVHVQREWNRTRQALREHRNANAPKYIVRDGLLDEDDEFKITNALPNQVIKLKNIPPEIEPSKFILPMQFSPIDSALYDTEPLEKDMMYGAGVQQANIGPAQPNVTATVGTIAEQSRLDVTSSNVDDLDAILTRMAQAAGEMMLQAMDPEIVKHIVGAGAVWPSEPATRQEFLSEIYLEIEAASSGRPNKALDIANWRDLAPLLQASGANPIGMVEETMRRLDENMALDKLFPLTPPAGAVNLSSPAEQGAPPKPNQPGAPNRESEQSAPQAPSPPVAQSS